MGRRAKNKQSSPEPLEQKVKSTGKKTGKRKADKVDYSAVRPSKKVKADTDDFKTYRGTIQQLDLGSDEDDEPLPVTEIKKLHKKPRSIISDLPSDPDSSDDEDEDGPVTMANMEARSRALDAQALAEAELDLDEHNYTALRKEGDESEGEDVDMDGEEDENGVVEEEPFHLPTPQEREEEKKNGCPDVQLVQRRMQACVRTLGKFRKFADKGR